MSSFLVIFGQHFAGLSLAPPGRFINQYNSLVLSHLQHAPGSIVHAVMSTARSSAVWQERTGWLDIL